MMTVPLHGIKAGGRVAMVDDADFELVSRYRWHVREAAHPGLRSNGPYARAHTYRNGRRVYIQMHNLIMGCIGIDHANGDGLDNQRSNLRIATTAQNGANRRKQEGTSSVFKGVTWHKERRRWIAIIRIGGKRRHLGRFANEEDAARAYDAAAFAAWGEFAHLNFPLAG